MDSSASKSADQTALNKWAPIKNQVGQQTKKGTAGQIEQAIFDASTSHIRSVDKKEVYFTSTGWQALSEWDAKQLGNNPSGVLVKFSAKELKSLLKTDSTFRGILLDSGNFLAIIRLVTELRSFEKTGETQQHEASSDSHNTSTHSHDPSISASPISLQTDSSSSPSLQSSALLTEKQWDKFNLQNILNLRYEEALGMLPDAFHSTANLSAIESKAKDSSYDKFSAQAVKNLNLQALAGESEVESRGSQFGSTPLEDNHSALINPEGEPFKADQNAPSGQASQRLLCKGYLEEKQICGDYVKSDHYDSHSVSVVIDASGNTDKSYKGAKQIGDDLVHGLNMLVDLHGNDLPTFEKELASLLNKLNEQHLARVKDGVHKPVTIAFGLVLNLKNRKQLAIMGSVGDARAMLKTSRDGKTQVHNVSKSNYNASYNETNGAMGDRVAISNLKKDPQARPIQIEAFNFQEGDLMILGSDGLGDNLEAKTLGVSPKKAAQLLKDANMLPEGIDIDSLSDKNDGWSAKGDFNPVLQEIHNAFIEYQAAILIEKDGNPADILFEHCTTNPNIVASSKLNKIQKEISEIREEVKKSVNDQVEKTESYKTSIEQIKQETEQKLRKEVIALRRSSKRQLIKDKFSSLRGSKSRQNEINSEVNRLIEMQPSQYNVKGLDSSLKNILEASDASKMKAFLKCRNEILDSSSDFSMNVASKNHRLIDLRNEMKKIGDSLVKGRPELSAAWIKAIDDQKKTDIAKYHDWRENQKGTSPIILDVDGPIKKFIDGFAMKSDDVGISTLTAKPQNV